MCREEVDCREIMPGLLLLPVVSQLRTSAPLEVQPKEQSTAATPSQQEQQEQEGQEEQEVEQEEQEKQEMEQEEQEEQQEEKQKHRNHSSGGGVAAAAAGAVAAAGNTETAKWIRRTVTTYGPSAVQVRGERDQRGA